MRFLFYISFFILFINCSGKLNNEKECYHWFNQMKHGLIQKKTIGGFILTMKYLPNQFIICKEILNDPTLKKEKNSLKEKYSHSMTFLLNIAPDSAAGNKGDIMLFDVWNKSDLNKTAI